MTEMNGNNTLSCTLLLKVEKVELKSNGTLSVVLKNTDSTDGEEHLIGNLITLQRTGAVSVSFEAMQQNLDL